MAGIRTCDRESQVHRPNHYTTEPPMMIIRCVPYPARPLSRAVPVLATSAGGGLQDALSRTGSELMWSTSDSQQNSISGGSSSRNTGDCSTYTIVLRRTVKLRRV